METAVKFGTDRSAPRSEIFLSSSGDVVAPEVASAAHSVGSDEETRTARRSGTKSPVLLVDFFQRKRHKPS
eukprot:SAG31_NODE_23266_length_507_cov_1.700980_1_plen_71_part_00